MSKQPVEEEIRNLLKAHYPMIYIVSYEETRVIDMLKNISAELDMELYAWSYTEGLVNQTADTMSVEEADPMKVLSRIQEHKMPAVFVLKDYHPFITEADICRKIRDLQNDTFGEYKPVIILSPVQKIPAELEKIVTILDYDLPGKEEIEITVDAAAEEISQACDFVLTSEDRATIVKACQGLTVDEITNILSKSWVETHGFNTDVVLTEKKQIIRKSGVLEYYDNLEEFANVGGMAGLKDWLSKRSVAFTDAAKAFGLPDPKGLLVLGIPGTGKSLLCKSVAGLWKVPLIRMDVGRIMSGLVGSSEDNMRKALRTAESISPCIMWIDEIEKGLSGTGSSNMSDAGTTARVFGTFIQWLQDKTAPVFVIATANNVSQLPPELLRKGRFDEIFFVDLPTTEERKDIFRIHLAKRGRNPENFDLDVLAADAVSAGFSGAEIEQTVISAMFNVFLDGEPGSRDIDTDSVVNAAKEIIPISKTSAEDIRKMKEWAKTRARSASFANVTRRSMKEIFEEK
jgi:ATP-dependent 26S proteasome regulatory subunit